MEGGLLYREEAHLGTRNCVVTATMQHRLARPELLQQLHRLLELGDPVRAGDARGLELLGVVPQPYAEVEAALGDMVQGGDVVGHVHRVEEGEQEYLGGEALHA